MAGRPEDDLECSICYDLLSEPLVLPCGHKYCKDCITRYMNIQETARCPCCRSGTPLRQSVPYLRPDANLMARVAAFRSQPQDGTPYCQEHPIKRVILSCRTCNNIKICDNCVIPGIGNHYGHTYGEMQEGSNQRQPGQVQITVKTEAGRPKAVLVFPSDTVESLKRKIHELTGTPSAEQRFIGGGKEFRDGHRLSEYNVREGMILQMVVRGIGGFRFR